MLGRMALLAATNSAALWTPANMTTALWIDAADNSTVTQSSGLITQINDKKGNNRNFTASGAARPTYTNNGLNGLPVITYGGAQRLTSVDPAATWNFLHNTTGNTVWIVAQVGNSSNPLAGYAYIGTNGAASANIGKSIYYDDASANDAIADFVTRGVSQSPVSDIYQANSITPKTASLLSVVGDPGNSTAANRSSVRVNGGSPIANNTATGAASTGNATYTLQLGDAGGNSFPLFGFIAEIIITNNPATVQTLQLVEGYLSWKWGIAALLPAGHPYKNAAPTI